MSAEEAAVLCFLADGQPRYGLDFVHAGILSENTLYVTLGLMVLRGLLTSSDESPPPARGIPRKLYRIAERPTSELFGPDFKKCPACRLIAGHPGPCASS